MDRIDDARLSFEENRATLTLEGDFVEAFEKYLADDEIYTVSLGVGRDTLEKLYEELRRALGDG